MNAEKPYNSYSEYFKQVFGGRVQKVSVDAGFTCPNRELDREEGGCLYCDNNAFNPSYCQPEKSISQQVLEGIEFHKKRYRRANSFLVYFQPYSNTYAPISVLREKYLEVLSIENVRGIIVGTLPDCIDENVSKLLAELSDNHYVHVELGVESVYDKTLDLINRGHDFQAVIDATELLSRYNITIGGHFIFGLPGETPDDWMNSIDLINNLPLKTIKFHQLQVVKGTKMESFYNSNPELFHHFTMESYIDFIVSFSERLNPDFIIERFAGEVPPRFISDSKWGIVRYYEVLKQIEKRFQERETYQGRLFSK